jgi:glycosyltransferase involved in cell wall biosynthesis
MPIYLGCEETLAAISSVLETCAGQIELIVIDDASPDPALQA